MREDAVVFEAVSKRYGAVQAVDKLSLTIKRGETVALLGPNGAGKSTSIGMLLGLIEPSGGTVRVLGGTPHAAVERGRIAAMLQDSGLMPGVKVGELLAFVRALYPRPMPLQRALAAAGLEGLTGRRVDRLSGGQAQRLRFAMALVADPEILVLDEPTAAMDVEARRAFWAAMRAEAATGRTVLFATHYLEEADENADRIVVIDQGRLIADGGATEIKALAGGRTVRFTLAGTSSDGLDRLPGVQAVELHGQTVLLRTSDADATVWALYHRRDQVRDLEVSGADLEEAFVALTGNGRDQA
jgi:ABC-2 type transport system ATP-binding protein